MARRRPNRTLGAGGDFLPAGKPNPSAQWLDLEAVRGCVPKCLEELAAISPQLPDGQPSTSAKYQHEGPLRDWAKRWNLTDLWLFRVARRTAYAWRKESRLRGRCWSYIVVFRKPQFPFPPRWDPVLETENDWRARVDAYAAGLKGIPGIERAPIKRTLEHFEWLARYQVEKWTQAGIAQYYQDENGQPDIPGVSRALKETAKLVGVTLRQAPGRPQRKC